MLDSHVDVWIGSPSQLVRDEAVAVAGRIGGRARSVTDGDALLALIPGGWSGVLVLDLRLRPYGGPGLLRRLADRSVVVSALGLLDRPDVPVVVDAMRLGCVDVIVGPPGEGVLEGRLGELIRTTRAADARRRAVDLARMRFAGLSERERDICDRLVQGHANKVIAFDLSISVRTVEVHRAAVMRKTGADSLAALVQSYFQVWPERAALLAG